MVAGGDQLKLRFLDLEHEGDGIACEVLLGLRTTFITPFDRADIQSQITSMDDSVDQCKATAKAITFEMTNFEPDMRKMADAVVDCSELAQRAVALLSDVAKNAAALNEICLQITRIEGDADDTYDEALNCSRKGQRRGRADFIRGSEIYKHLEIPPIALTTSLTRFKRCRARLNATGGPSAMSDFAHAACRPSCDCPSSSTFSTADDAANRISRRWSRRVCSRPMSRSSGGRSISSRSILWVARGADGWHRDHLSDGLASKSRHRL